MTAFEKWCNELSDRDKVALICRFYDESVCSDCPLNNLNDCFDIKAQDVQDFLHKKIRKPF